MSMTVTAIDFGKTATLLFTEFQWLPADYWDLSIPVYLYFAAVAGGAYLAGVSACVLRSRQLVEAEVLAGEIARWGFMLAVGSAAVAGLAVLSHLAVIYRAILFPVYLTNFSSWITIGTWILVLLAILAVVSLLFQLFGEQAAEESRSSGWPRLLLAKIGVLDWTDRAVDRVRLPAVAMSLLYGVGSLLAVATIYTGFELAVVQTVPLWHQPVLLPVLFLTSGVAAGVGLTVAMTMLFERRFAPVFGGYAVAVGLLSLTSFGVAVYGWHRIATTDAPAAAASHAHLSSGTLYFGVLLVALGFLAAAISGLAFGVTALFNQLPDRVERIGGPVLIGSFSLLAVGGLVLRLLLLLAAEQNPVVVAL